VKNIEIKNRKAKFEYYFLDTYEAGIMLTGTEVKSVRAGHANLNDAYCAFSGDELWVHSMYIKEYAQGTHFNHNTRKDRKLLLNKKELRKIQRLLTEKGMTIVPYRLFVNDRGFIKLDIAVAKGKKTFDKRHSIKERDVSRELDRNIKY
jgi:SsrA-binding protein